MKGLPQVFACFTVTQLMKYEVPVTSQALRTPRRRSISTTPDSISASSGAVPGNFPVSGLRPDHPPFYPQMGGMNGAWVKSCVEKWCFHGVLLENG